MPDQKSAVLVPPRQRQSRPLTVASVPAGHVYVRHLAPLDGGGPRRLPDPVPAGGPSWGASEAERRQQRHEVAAAHDAIYQGLVR